MKENDFRLGRWIQIKNIVLIICSTALTATLYYMSNSWASVLGLSPLVMLSSIKTTNGEEK